jgi:effector-binding domain-containing protein
MELFMHYQEKRNDQSTFLGKIFHRYYDAQCEKYGERYGKIINWFAEHEDEIGASKERISTFRS